MAWQQSGFIRPFDIRTSFAYCMVWYGMVWYCIVFRTSFASAHTHTSHGTKLDATIRLQYVRNATFPDGLQNIGPGFFGQFGRIPDPRGNGFGTGLVVAVPGFQDLQSKRRRGQSNAHFQIVVHNLRRDLGGPVFADDVHPHGVGGPHQHVHESYYGFRKEGKGLHQIAVVENVAVNGLHGTKQVVPGQRIRPEPTDNVRYPQRQKGSGNVRIVQEPDRFLADRRSEIDLLGFRPGLQQFFASVAKGQDGRGQQQKGCRNNGGPGVSRSGGEKGKVDRLGFLARVLPTESFDGVGSHEGRDAGPDTGCYHRGHTVLFGVRIARVLGGLC
mmetsp:Transcript_4685/g.10271  ORF Transcript_4685/g.10271 Transcript_4685/m.10271 type:complete len:329 (-) Transcript_4685:2416-3402(-)